MFALPSWGLHYCIKANTPSDATDTDDTWGFATAPVSYYSGGTWLAMYTGSENKEAAWDYISTVTMNVDYLTEYVNQTGDMVGYIPAIEAIIDSGFRDSFTGDQDIYSYMYEAALAVDARDLTTYDTAVVEAMKSQIALVTSGEKTIEEGIADFQSDVITQYPEITVE